MSNSDARARTRTDRIQRDSTGGPGVVAGVISMACHPLVIADGGLWSQGLRECYAAAPSKSMSTCSHGTLLLCPFQRSAFVVSGPTRIELLVSCRLPTAYCLKAAEFKNNAAARGCSAGL